MGLAGGIRWAGQRSHGPARARQPIEQGSPTHHAEAQGFPSTPFHRLLRKRQKRATEAGTFSRNLQSARCFHADHGFQS